MDLQLLQSKKEVTYGVDPTNAAANTTRAGQLQLEPQGQTVEIDVAKPGEGADPHHIYGQHYVFGYRVPLIGSGTEGVAPKFGAHLKACGWAEAIVADTSVTYTRMFSARNADSLTHKYREGLRATHMIKGWRGRFGVSLNAGEQMFGIFDGRGLHSNPTHAGADLSNADADFSGWLDSLVVSQGTTQFEFAGVDDLGFRKFSFEQSDNVKFYDLPGQESVQLRGKRVFTGSFTITKPAMNVLNLEAKWDSRAVEDFSVIHGATAGEIVTINGKAQLTSVQYGREDEEETVTCGFKLVPSDLTADDEISIVFT